MSSLVYALVQEVPKLVYMPFGHVSQWNGRIPRLPGTQQHIIIRRGTIDSLVRFSADSKPLGPTK